MGNRIYLKPCSFCGGDAYIAETMNKLHIDCNHTNDCMLTPNTWLISSKNLQEQIKYWNTRYSKQKEEDEYLVIGTEDGYFNKVNMKKYKAAKKRLEENNYG